MLKDDCCYHRFLALRGISLHWKLLLSQVNKLTLFFALKKSEQAEIVAFNRLLVNYNIHFFYFIGAKTRELVLTVVTQDRKICNGRTNDFSFFSLLCKDTERKQYIPHSSIHNWKC